MKKIENSLEKSLFNWIKRLLLHPQQRYTLFEILTSTTNKLEKLFFEKGYEKLVRLENGYYICTPQNMGSSLKDWLGIEEKLKRNFQKKLQDFLARYK